MEKLSLFFTNYILKKEVISKENYEIYLYGFQSGLEILINVICCIIIAVSLGMVIEAALFFAFFIPLRSYGGGLHMEKFLACLFFSCVTLSTILLLVKYLSLIPIVSIILYCISLLIIKIAGPVSHPNRPVKQEEILKFKKRGNLILIICSIIAIAFLAMEFQQYLFLEVLTFALVASTTLFGKFLYS